MRPYPEEVLRAIQSGIVAHFAPEVESTYGKAQFAFSMMLFTIALRDYDSAVPDLLEANGTLRGRSRRPARNTERGTTLAKRRFR